METLFDRNVTKKRQGAAHGFICATQNEMNQCKLPDYTTTTIGVIGTTTKTTEASVTTATTTRSTSTSVSMVSLLNSVFGLFVLL